MTTTTDEMLAALSTKAEKATAAAAAAEQEYADLRVKVQESAWALGWQHSIGSVMEEMLEELGLQGRPTRVGGTAKVRLTVRLPEGLSGDPYIASLSGSGIGTASALTVTQERSVTVGSIYLPAGTEVDSGRCWCDVLDEHADPEQVVKAVREYHGWTEGPQVEVLALRCNGHPCSNRERTDD